MGLYSIEFSNIQLHVRKRMKFSDFISFIYIPQANTTLFFISGKSSASKINKYWKFEISSERKHFGVGGESVCVLAQM